MTASDGEKIHSDNFLIRRGVVQSDIFSPLCFIIALCVLLEMFCGVPDDCAVGLFGLLIKSLEYADDATLIDLTAEKSTERINQFIEGSVEAADMVVSVEKTKCMHVDSELVQHFSRISVGEADYSDTSLVKTWDHVCLFCGWCGPSQHGLAIHTACWCGEAQKKVHEKDFEVENILQARGSVQHRFYEVQWKGFTERT